MIRFAYFLMVLFVVGFVHSAHATSVAFEDTPRLTQLSDHIVRGTVQSVQSRWHGGIIVTDITLSVAHTLKGSHQASLSFTQPGGTLGTTALNVSGAPTFKAGQEVLVCLEYKAGLWVEPALGASHWRIKRHTSGVHAIRSTHHLLAEDRSHLAQHPQSLKELEAAIHSATQSKAMP